jgi:hypothetical protein
MTNPVTVALDDPPKASLMALLMKGLVDDALKIDANGRAAAALRGAVRVRAGRREVVMVFNQGAVRIVTGGAELPVRAGVAGGMRDLLGIVTGGGMVWPVLSGRLRIAGNPFFLLKLLPLIRRGG